MSARRVLREQSRFTAAHDVLFRLLDTKFSGTWRTVHQLGHEGTPSFMPFDAMGYLAFFGKNDPLGRELEWWQGAVLPR